MAEKTNRKNPRLDLACTCGARISGEGSDDIITGLRVYWQQEHSGAGHGPATVDQARRARAKRESERRFIESD